MGMDGSNKMFECSEKVCLLLQLHAWYGKSGLGMFACGLMHEYLAKALLTVVCYSPLPIPTPQPLPLDCAV